MKKNEKGMQVFKNLGVISRGQDLLTSKVEISAQNLFHMVWGVPRYILSIKKFGCSLEKNPGNLGILSWS